MTSTKHKKVKKQYASTKLFPKNRKGVEHFQLIVNNIFYIMMLVIGIVLVANSVASMKTTYEFRLENVRFNNYAARVMYSGDCFAYEDTYTSELGTKHRVYPATIDVNKLSSERLGNCLVGLGEKSGFEVAIAEISDAAISKSSSGDAVSTTGSVIYGLLTTGAATDDNTTEESTEEETFADLELGETYYSSRANYNAACKNKKDWDRIATFFVDVHNGTVVNKGLLKFCYGK